MPLRAALGVTSKKETAIKSTFYVFSFMTSIILPNILAAWIGNNEIKSFCNKHADICTLDSNSDNGSDLDFPRLASRASYLGAGIGSFVTGILASFLIILALTVGRSVRDCNKNESFLGESSPLVRGSTIDKTNFPNPCIRLFKQYKQNVLSTKFDLYQLFVTAASLLGSMALAIWYTAVLTQDAVCLNEDCDSAFPTASADQLQQLSKLSKHVYNTILSSGIIFGTITTLSVAAATMGVVVCIKNQLQKNEARRIRAGRAGVEMKETSHHKQINFTL